MGFEACVEVVDLVDQVAVVLLAGVVLGLGEGKVRCLGRAEHGAVGGCEVHQSDLEVFDIMDEAEDDLRGRGCLVGAALSVI